MKKEYSKSDLLAAAWLVLFFGNILAHQIHDWSLYLPAWLAAILGCAVTFGLFTLTRGAVRILDKRYE